MKTILSLSLILTIFVNSFVASAKVITKSEYYTDVDDAQEFFKAIEYISDKEIVEGYGDGTFQPSKNLNRAELLKILIKAKYDYKDPNHDGPNDYYGHDKESCFTDVPAKQWYTEYVCFGKKIGIVSGYSDGSFKPGNDVNLVEAVKMALRTFEYDYKETDPWYKIYVDKAAEFNLIPLNFKHFNDKVNRGQMADLIARVLKYRDGSLDSFLGENSKFVVDYETLKNGQGAKVIVKKDEKKIAEYHPLISKVCGTKDKSSDGVTYLCDADLQDIYHCSTVRMRDYGGHNFGVCEIVHDSEGNLVVDALINGGGFIPSGYNYLLLKGDEVVAIDSVEKLLENWGKIDSEESAKWFAVAATWDSLLDVGTHFTDAFGEDFKLSIPESEVKFTVVKKVGDKYEVPLYYETVFGCADFPVYQNIYTVSNNGLKLKETKTIGETFEEICVD